MTSGTGAPWQPRGWGEVEGLVCGFGDRNLSAPRQTLLLRQQVHGDRVVDARRVPRRTGPDASDGLARLDVDADALVAAAPGIVVGVRTADCVPLLLIAPRTRWAAAVHAGWRGTLAGIAVAAVQQAADAGVHPEELLAALGPSIGPCCYEVSEELGGSFRQAGLHDATTNPAAGRRPHLDLREANRRLLLRSGLLPEHLQLVGPCTRCASDRFHSFRAEPGSAGRQVSWIGWR